MKTKRISLKGLLLYTLRRSRNILIRKGKSTKFTKWVDIIVWIVFFLVSLVQLTPVRIESEMMNFLLLVVCIVLVFLVYSIVKDFIHWFTSPISLEIEKKEILYKGFRIKLSDIQTMKWKSELDSWTNTKHVYKVTLNSNQQSVTLYPSLYEEDHLLVKHLEQWLSSM